MIVMILLFINSNTNELTFINHPGKTSLLNDMIVNKSSENIQIIGNYGSNACSLTASTTSSSNDYERDIKICPWHYELESRNDRFII
jgi:hypothetical protein